MSMCKVLRRMFIFLSKQSFATSVRQLVFASPLHCLFNLRLMWLTATDTIPDTSGLSWCCKTQSYGSLNTQRLKNVLQHGLHHVLVGFNTIIIYISIIPALNQGHKGLTPFLCTWNDWKRESSLQMKDIRSREKNSEVQLESQDLTGKMS